MRLPTSRSHLVLVTGLGLGLVLPTVAASPSRAEAAPARVRRVKAVAFAPLFDTFTRFRVKKTVELRFRAREALSGAPIPSDDISFFLRHDPDETTVQLPAKELRKGIFAIPFTPSGPGQYWLSAAVRAAPAGSIPAVHLGVVGVVEGLVEVPPEQDPEVKGAQKRQTSRLR